MKWLLLPLLLVSTNAFATDDAHSFVSSIIENGGLKSAVRSYLATQTPAIMALAASQTESTAYKLMTTERNLLLQDIDASEYVIDDTGSKCGELEAPGLSIAHVKVDSQTEFAQPGANICFNLPGLTAAYGKLSNEQLAKLLVSFALHEHVHHFQKSPGREGAIRLANERDAYRLQAYVLNSINSGLTNSLKFETPQLTDRNLEDLNAQEFEDTHRPLVVGDKVVLAGPLRQFLSERKKSQWEGLQYNWGTLVELSTPVSTNFPNSELTVIGFQDANGKDDPQDLFRRVVVNGTVEGQPFFDIIPHLFLAKAYGRDGKLKVGDVVETMIAIEQDAEYHKHERWNHVIEREDFVKANGLQAYRNWHYVMYLKVQARIVGFDTTWFGVSEGHDGVIVEVLKLDDPRMVKRVWHVSVCAACASIGQRLKTAIINEIAFTFFSLVSILGFDIWCRSLRASMRRDLAVSSEFR